MNAIINISIKENFRILCSFKNGEQRIFDVPKVLNLEKKFVTKIFKTEIFKNAKIGSFGEIYWNNVAEMKGLKGEVIPCEYDISPEFIYQNSTLVE